MRAFFGLTAIVLVIGTFANASEVIPQQLTCESRSQHERLDFKIYSNSGKYTAELYQETRGNRQEYDNDGSLENEVLRSGDATISLNLVSNGARGLIFEQQSSIKGLARGVKITITNEKAMITDRPAGGYGRIAKVSANKGPFGEAVSDKVVCW